MKTWRLDTLAFAARAAARSTKGVAVLEYVPTREASRRIDVQSIPLRVKRTREVLEVREDLFLAEADRHTERASGGLAAAQLVEQRLPGGLDAR